MMKVVLVIIISFLAAASAQRCRAPRAPPNGAMQCARGRNGLHTINAQCTFVCDAGFELIGSDTVSCQRTGRSNRYTPNPPSCQAITAPVSNVGPAVGAVAQA